MKRVLILASAVVWLALLLAGPVLAAVVWEWNAGDFCRWTDGDSPKCYDGSIFLTNGGEAYTLLTEDENFDTGSLVLVENCTTAGGILMVAVSSSQYGAREWDMEAPYDNIDFTAGDYLIFSLDEFPEEYCSISSVQLDNGQVEPEPSGSFDFSLALLLSISGQIVTGLLGVLVIIWGLSLGVGIIRKFVEARWGG